MTDAIIWRKSSASSQNGECVEIADLPDGDRLVRDTKDHGRGPILRFNAAEWQAFTRAVRNGEFD